MPAARRGPVLLLALVLVAALVALAIWALRDEPVTPPDVRPGTPAPARRTPTPPKRPVRRPGVVDVRRPTVPETPETPAGMTPMAALEAAVKVTVVVRHASGAPAVGADVYALDPLGSHLSPPAPEVREKKTASDEGQVEFAISGGTTVLLLFASHEDAAAVAQPVDLAGGGERRVEMTLAEAPRLRVRVLDLEGTPVAGAWVRATWYSKAQQWHVRLAQNVDREGETAFPAVPLDPRGAVVLEAGARGFLQQETTLEPSTVRTDVVELRLEPGAAVRGIVVDEAGKPVANAEARILGTGRGEASNAEGRFEVQNLPREGGTLWVHREDFAPTLVRDLRGDTGDVDVGTVVLRPGGRVAGIVVATDGTPVVDAAVSVTHAESGQKLGESRTQRDGTFSFDRMPNEALAVEAAEARTAKDWAVGLKATARDVLPGGGDIRLTLSGAATVHLRFLDDADRTAVVVSSVKLTARPAGDQPAEAAWAWSGAGIDAVRFQPDAVGLFDITVEVPGYEPGTAHAVEVLPDRETRIDVLFRKRPM